jgi:hypothetical protein
MLFKDQQMLAEAYQQIIENAKCNCAYAKKPGAAGADSRACSCDCDKCEDCKKNQKLEEGKKPKPDYLDVDKDKNKKESMKKALSDKKKAPKFKDLHKEVMSKSKKK